jgi:hypothetical protein
VKRIWIFSFVLTLSGCAGSWPVYDKSGATYSQVTQDTAECKAKEPFFDPVRALNKCMAKKGYHVAYAQ